MWVVRGLVVGGAVAALVVAGCPAPGGSLERPPSDTASDHRLGTDDVPGEAPDRAPGYGAEWCDR